MLLSVVMPLRNHTALLPQLEAGVRQLQAALPYPFEVVVVDDGSDDGTARQASRHGWTVLRQDRLGPGVALRRGMLAARGHYRALVDPLWTVAPEQLQLMLPPALVGVDVALGSRNLPDSTRGQQPLQAAVLGRIFHRIVETTTLPGLSDVNSGFAVFRAETAHAIFDRCREQGWGILVEAFALARELGVEVHEVPVDWTSPGRPRLSLTRDGPDLLAALLRVNTRLASGTYPPLRATVDLGEDADDMVL